MSASEHTVTSDRGRDQYNRIRAVVTLSTGATTEFTSEWAHAWANRSIYFDTASRADRLVKEVRSSKAAQVTWPALGVSIVRIDVSVDERTTWVEEHDLRVSKLHAIHEFGSES